MITIPGKAHDLGDGFIVRHYLPQAMRRSVGPFIFFDYFGPVDFPPGRGVDVRPHPHIGLATITYLFDGAQMHRDTLGSVQEIKPGDVNWMTAGRGIAHSERTGDATRAAGHRLHGIQTWVGLPEKDQESPPGFQHMDAADLPQREEFGVRLRMAVGEAFGLASPIQTFSPIFYAEALFDTGGSFTVTPDHPERAVFIVEGDIQVGSESHGVHSHEAGTMLLLEPGETVTLYSDSPARVMLLGGVALDGHRYIWWNFVSASKERIELAKADWQAGLFGTIPGDDKEFIPLPD